MMTEWAKETNVGITVCDSEGIIIYLNDLALKIFEKSGGSDLIGKNLLDCHPENTKQKIISLYNSKKNNCYTVVINNIKYLLYQSPWFDDGEFAGFVEFIYSLPENIPELEKIHWVD